MCKRNRVSWFMIIVFMMTIFGGGFGAGNSKAEAATQPTDINGHWAQSQIEKAFAQGFVNGYPDGTFKPDQNVSRAEFVTMVNNAFGFKAETSTYFTDVKDTDWFAGQISRAKAAGYISGYEDGSFKPDNYISRQEVAAIMAQINKTSNPAGIDLLSRFKDADAISSWAQGAVASVIASGTMQGYPDQTFKPQNFITRAEAVVVLNQAIGIEPQPVTQSITSITVTGAGDATTVKNGSTLQMSAAVLPANATDKSITWSLTNGTGTATIAEAGLLTGTGLGTVTVKATANDGSGVSGTEQITVTVATSSAGGGGGSSSVAVSAITNADVAVTTGSVIFGYTFTAIGGTVTYADAIAAPYYLNVDTSTVTLTDGSNTSSAVSMNDLEIADDSTVEYEDLVEILLDFNDLDFVPTEVLIHLVGASSVNSGSDEWTKDVTVTLDTGEVALLAVVTAEGSNLQAYVDVAQALIIALPDGTAKTALQGRIDAVQAIINAETLADAKAATLVDLAAAFGGYVAGNYTTDNWTALTGFDTAGITNIGAATDLDGVSSAQTTAIEGMAGVQTISVTSPLASFTAVTLTQTGDVASSNVQYTDAAAVIAALPATIAVTLVNSTVVNVPVTWAATDIYNAATAADYTFTATWGTMPAGANNDNSLAVPTVEVTVAPTICGHDIELGGFTSKVSITDTDKTGYAIYTAAQLQHMAMHPTENAILMNDIVIPATIGASTTDTAMGVLSAAAIEYGFTSGHDISKFLSGNFVPIGFFKSHTTYIWPEGGMPSEITVIDVNAPYTGIFDGNGYTISGLNINGDGVGYVGLFGYTSGAEIKNLIIEDATVDGLKYIGGVVGYMNGGSITNVSTTGSGLISGNGDLGGIVGVATGSAISNVSNNLATDGDNIGGGIAGQINYSTLSHARNTGRIIAPCAGGLVGLSNYSTVEFSYNTGIIGGNISQEGYRPVGGLVGQNNCSIVSNSYNTGSVAGSWQWIGGVVGISGGTEATNSQIVNVYNTGAVNGIDNVGGIVGEIDYYNQISYVYNTGTVTGTAVSWGCVGGIVGGFQYFKNTLTNSYNRGSVSGGDSATTGSVAGFVRTQEYALDNINTVSDCYWLVGTYTKGIGNSYGSTSSFASSDSVIMKIINDAISAITNIAN